MRCRRGARLLVLLAARRLLLRLGAPDGLLVARAHRVFAREHHAQRRRRRAVAAPHVTRGDVLGHRRLADALPFEVL